MSTPLPLTRGIPLLGNSLEIARDPLGFIVRSQREFPDIFRVNTFARPVVVVSHPEMAAYVLQENHRNYHKSFDYEILALALGKGLLTNEGDSWLRQRRLAQPAFHRQRLALLYDIMLEETEALCNRWQEFAGTERVVNISAEMMQLTMRIVARALFGVDVSKESKAIGDHITVVNEWVSDRAVNALRFPLWVPSAGNLRFKSSLRFLDDTIYAMIRQRKQDAVRRTDLMDMLLYAEDEDTGERMSEQQLRDEVITLFLAGHETSANALAWTFAECMFHPEAAARVKEETLRICGGQLPRAEQLNAMTYSRQVLDEGMRLHPPAFVMGRRNYKKDFIGGYEIPEETNVIISTYTLHRDPRWWSHPEQFDPERFSEVNSKNRMRNVYLPFGTGPRLCIGMHFALQEMQLILSAVLSRFTLQPADTRIPAPEALVTLRPKGGVHVFIRSN